MHSFPDTSDTIATTPSGPNPRNTIHGCTAQYMARPDFRLKRLILNNPQMVMYLMQHKIQKSHYSNIIVNIYLHNFLPITQSMFSRHRCCRVAKICNVFLLPTRVTFLGQKNFSSFMDQRRYQDHRRQSDGLWNGQ